MPDDLVPHDWNAEKLRTWISQGWEEGLHVEFKVEDTLASPQARKTTLGKAGDI